MEEGEEGVQLVYADEATGYRCVGESLNGDLGATCFKAGSGGGLAA